MDERTNLERALDYSSQIDASFLDGSDTLTVEQTKATLVLMERAIEHLALALQSHEKVIKDQINKNKQFREVLTDVDRIK